MLELLLVPFFIRALIVGLLLGALMAILGVLVVLRQMSFFSDAIGHSALTGIALGILFNQNPFLGALVFTLLIAAGIVALRHYSRLKLDTILGILFPTTMAGGVILLRLTPGYRTDLVAYLFGDILTVTPFDIGTTALLAIIVSIVLIMTGKKLFTITLNEDLAKSEGINTAAYELVLLLTLAAVIAMAIKLVGIILVTAMLIIPAATAQNIARSILTMFGISVTAGLIAVTAGMIGSALFNVPSGPAIVLAAAFICLCSFVVARHPTNKVRGSILLSLSVIIFICSLAAAAFVGYERYGKESTDSVKAVSPTDAPTTTALVDVLNPQITIDEKLQEHEAELQKNLIRPLRRHFATRAERLSAITITARDDTNYPLTVSVTLLSPDHQERVISFPYDLTPWQASLLNTETTE